MTSPHPVPRVHFRSQFNDPSTTQDGFNCTSAAYCMLLELATGIEMYPGEFREFQSDTGGGISIPDGARAWNEITDAQLEYAAPHDGSAPPTRRGDGLFAHQAWERLRDGDGMVLQGLYSVIEDAGYSLQPGFNDGHAMYVDGWRTSNGINDAYVMDPLGKGSYDGEWMPWSVLVRYAEALGTGDLMYAAWASPMLPDTDTEVQMTYDWLPGATTGRLSVKGTGHYYLRLADDTLNGPLNPNDNDWQDRLAFGPVKMKGGKLSGSSCYVIGTEAAFLLVQDVTFTPEAGGDNTHTVQTVVDGVVRATVTV